jgi:hypothetical protein
MKFVGNKQGIFSSEPLTATRVSNKPTTSHIQMDMDINRDIGINVGTDMYICKELFVA